jgi:DNA-binding MarR family transcriptional regulator
LERDRKIGLVFSDVSRFRGILFDQMMKRHGLTHVQAIVLAQLFRQDGLTQTELAEMMSVGTVNISGLVDRLEAKGWVERRPDEHDRRAKRVWLSPKVEQIRKRIDSCITDINSITVEGMDDDEVEQLIRLMRKAKANMAARMGNRGAD